MTARKTKLIQRMLAGISRRASLVAKAQANLRHELDVIIASALALKREIDGVVTNSISPKKTAEMMRKKRRLSPEARERIALAARKRWAAYRKAKKKA